MSGPINHARAKISKIFNGEPQSYTRFNLAPNTDGDNSQVEVKLSTEVEEELDVPEAGHRHAGRSPARTQLCTSRNMFYMALGVLLIFVTGYLVGYMTHQKPMPSQGSAEGVECPSLQLADSNDEGVVNVPEPTLDWNDITGMLRSKLSSSAFVQTLSEFSSENHQAGSQGDEVLANKVLGIFSSLRMNPWNDEHYVQLQMPSRNDMNKVFFGSEEVGSPQGYLAYSAPGVKQGRVVYANYGRVEDLKYLQDVGINLNGTVVLLRTGKISLAEKVANAAKFAAVAVLIYPEIPGNYDLNTELYGHVHFGTGDPYTPGFPSFNHTQFPPSKSSGLPEILAQTITAAMACEIHKKMGGKDAPVNFKGKLIDFDSYKLGDSNNIVKVVVKNNEVDTRIHNIFGVIKGFVDPDRYVVIGAQRDSFSWGYAKSTVGTSLLVELAKAITEMIKAGFRPRRSIVFASWSAGDFGSIGSTEWLEGYLASLDRKAFTYISLDGAVSGGDLFKASGSPLLHKLLKETLNEVKILAKKDRFLYQKFDVVNFEAKVLEPMKMEDGAYPFLAFSGIPSISFRFVSDEASPHYKYFGTPLDTKDRLDIATGQKVGDFCVSAAQVAGQMALRLVHDHLLRLDVTTYTSFLRKHVAKINMNLNQLIKSSVWAPTQLSARWLISAVGSYSRAADDLLNDAQNSDLEDEETCRKINDRIMRVEHNLLSPYVSPRDVPFRHILFGFGNYTLTALEDHLKNLKTPEADTDLLRNQLALTTWTIQSCANDLAGDVWVLDNMV
ncbi:transferrin receptor 1b isoform X2 [Electrophorus electricus]|uniref:transferrin receptor 1b isoform X2 n=1 Tax=Electrophorus electricus TaxID=8005 RepID=UPI0015D068F7|nr:transferrin receptor 1b isoform X2 [Electrophorus electricus]